MKPAIKRAIFVVAAGMVAVLLATRDTWQEPLLGALGFSVEGGRYLGYVEGETSLIAPPVAGQLLERPVERGQRVKKGERLFVIDPMLARAEVARARAALAESNARHENLLTGKRPFHSNRLEHSAIPIDPKPPRQIDDTIPKELERICLKAMSYRVSDRYNAATDLAADLQLFLHQSTASSAPPAAAAFPTSTAWPAPRSPLRSGSSSTTPSRPEPMLSQTPSSPPRSSGARAST